MNRFWEKVDKTDDCWLWTAAINKNGYGVFWSNGKMVRAHRFAYELEHGEIAEGKVLAHKCDRRACIRPSHLVPSTHKQNVDDKIKKGRHPSGEDSTSAKLCAQDVLSIRYDGRSHETLSHIFGVSRSTITLVKQRKRYADIGEYVVKKRGKYLTGHSYATALGYSFYWANEIPKARVMLKSFADNFAALTDGDVVRVA